MIKRPLNVLTDLELADLLKVGDETAFGFIYDRYWNKLYVIARNRLKDKEEAEEVVQDIFCNLWRRRHSFQLSKSFDNYFAIAVKFEVINRLSKTARATEYQKQLIKGLSDVDESTLLNLDYNELQQRFQLAVNSLPDQCRIVFRLQHDDGYSHQQIADELSISKKTVEAHLSKARKTLRGALGNFLGLIL